MIDVFVKTSQVVEDERMILSYTRVRTLIRTQNKKNHELDLKNEK